MSRNIARTPLLFAILLALAAVVRAHEARPAYLEIKETGPGRYDLLWRTPVLSGMRLPIVLRVPEGVRNVTEPTVQELTDSLLERRSIDAGPSGLAGKRIEFPGLQATITDVFVRYKEGSFVHALRYNSGLSNYFEVLYAMQLLYPAEQLRIAAEINLLNDCVNIYKALGGGWNLQPEDPNPNWFSPAAVPAAPAAPK